MIQERNTASKEAAWDALDMGTNDRDGRLRAFDLSLLNEPWVEIEVGPGTKMKVLWHTHLKEVWVELTVLRLLNVATSVSASFEVHDEGTAAQQLVQKAVGQGVLVHPVGDASFTDRRKFRNFPRIAQSVWLPPVSVSFLDPCMGRERFGPLWAQEAVGRRCFCVRMGREASTCRRSGKPLPASVKKSNAQERGKSTKNLGGKGGLAGFEPKCTCSKSRAQTRLRGVRSVYALRSASKKEFGNRKWIKANIKKEVKGKLTLGVSPPKKAT